MSSSEGALLNDEYGWVDAATGELLEASRHLVETGEAARISDRAVQEMFTAAVRLYYAKADCEDRTFLPLVNDKRHELTPTEMLSAVGELLRCLHLGPMELALWARRRPEDE
jgi:hypothetical protein